MWSNLSLSVCLSICLSAYLSICLSHSHYLPRSLFIYLALCQSFPISVSLYLSFSLSLYASLCLSISLFLSFFLYFFLAIYLTLMLHNAALLRKSRPWPPSMSDGDVSCAAPATQCILADPLHMSHAYHRFWKCCKTHTFGSFLARCRALRLPLIMTIRRPKVVRTWCVFNMVPSKCASRHNGVHFFDISTSKTALRMVCFDHFDIEMRFTPQLRWCVFRILTWTRFAPQWRAINYLSSHQMAPHPSL